MSLTKDISQLFQKTFKNSNLSDQSKTCEDPKKMRDESCIKSSTDMRDDVFAESLKLTECIGPLFNSLRNVER